MLIPPERPRSAAPPPDEGGAAPVEERLVAPALRAIAAMRSGDGERLAMELDGLCGDARRAGLPVERVIVVLKQLWQARAPEEPPRTRVSADQLARLVSDCIIAYYHEHP